MSKELKALNAMLELFRILSLSMHNKLLGRYNLSGGFGNHFLTVRKALTPPTQEELCKKLSEYIDEEVNVMIKNNFYMIKTRINKKVYWIIVQNTNYN